jgi:hypothetical protein
LLSIVQIVVYTAVRAGFKLVLSELAAFNLYHSNVKAVMVENKSNVFKAESVCGSQSTADSRLQDIRLRGTQRKSYRALREKNLRLSIFMDSLP